jgi:AraC family transcriptional regulator
MQNTGWQETSMMLQVHGALASTADTSHWSTFSAPFHSLDHPPFERPHGLNGRALHRALAFIEANLGERFTLETLAAYVGISRFHFARLFRLATGYSPMEYLMRQRIERGKLILTRGEYSICEIAALLGFCDQSHFTRTFRRMTRMSPRDYARAKIEQPRGKKRIADGG